MTKIRSSYLYDKNLYKGGINICNNSLRQLGMGAVQSDILFPGPAIQGRVSCLIGCP